MMKRYKIVFRVAEMEPFRTVVPDMQTIVEIDEERALYMGDAYVELMLDTGLDAAVKHIRDHVRTHVAESVKPVESELAKSFFDDHYTWGVQGLSAGK